MIWRDHTDPPSASSKAHFQALQRKIVAFEETGLKPQRAVKMFPLLGFWPDNEAETGACLCRGTSYGRQSVSRRTYRRSPAAASWLSKVSIVFKGQDWNTVYATTQYDFNLNACAPVRLRFFLPPYQVPLPNFPWLHSFASINQLPLFL